MSYYPTDEKNGSAFSGKKRWAIITGIILLMPVLVLLCSVIILRWFDPSFSSFTLRENWNKLDRERYNLREYWVPDEALPDHLKWAVIASEDQRFREHFGLDWSAIEKAMDEYKRGERQRGASTITQQVAKNLYLWPGQTWFRKILEAGIAVLIEVFWTKDRILEVYLNIAEFGPGMYGTGKATSEWFGKGPSELVPVESARMAAVLPDPKRMRVEPPSPYAEERSRWILQQMTRISGIAYVPVTPADMPSDSVDSLVNPALKRTPMHRGMDPVIWESDSGDRATDPNRWGVELDIDLERNYNREVEFEDRMNLDRDIDSRSAGDRPPERRQQTVKSGDFSPSDNSRLQKDIREDENKAARDLDSLVQNSLWEEPDLSFDVDSLFKDTLKMDRE